MSLFGNGKQEEFLLFMRNFNMNLAASVTLETDSKIKYLRTIVHCEALHHFDILSADMEST